MIGSFLSVLLIAGQLWSQDSGQGNIDVFNFGGLNDSISSDLIDNFECQSCLNVESNINGTAILNRPGFQLSATLNYSTSSVSGSHLFIDNSGNQDQIVCNDHQCSVLVNGGAPTVFLSTPTLPNYWQFVDINGTMYGVNNKNDPPISYNGSTLSNPATMPLGAVIELTKDRLVIAGTTGNPNRVYYSQSGTYTNFTTGINSADPWTDDFGTTGDKITGLKYDRGKLFIFKRTSITACLVADQYSTKCYPISNNIGTSDPLDIVSVPDGIYFRAQDRTYWKIDDYGLTLISKKIINFVKSQTSGSQQQSVQNTQAAWQAGTQFPGVIPTLPWDTKTIVGSVFPSSSTFLDISTGNFSAGTSSGTGVSIDNPGIVIGGIPEFYSAQYNPSDGKTPDNVLPSWNKFPLPGGTNCTSSVASSTLTISCPAGQEGQNYLIYEQSVSIATNTILVLRTMPNSASSPKIFSSQPSAFGFIIQNGSNQPLFVAPHISMSSSSIGYWMSGVNSPDVIENFLGSVTPSTFTILIGNNGNARMWRNGSLKLSGTLSGASINSINASGFGLVNPGTLDSPSILYTQQYTFVYFSTTTVSDPGATSLGISTFTSRIFDSGYSTPTAGPFASTNTLPDSNTSITWNIRSSTSPNNDLWTSYELLNLPVRPTKVNNRYIQYKANLFPDGFVFGPIINTASLQYATTGQFDTQCIQPPSGISAWGLLTCGTTISGAGSLVFYTTSAATCATLPTGPPNTWQTTTGNNTVPTISTNTAMFIGFRSLLGSSTDQAQVDNCTQNWTVGTASPPGWGVYDSIKNSIYFTAAINNSGTNNRVLKYDLNLNQWFPFSLNANALKEVNNQLYFGDSTAGKWYAFGNVQNDNGAAINSFWKSKDFHGSPVQSGSGAFNDTIWQDLSVIARNQVVGSLTATWATSLGQTGNYTISLSTVSSITYVRSNSYLPYTSAAPFFNVQFGNNVANGPWELDGLEIGYYTNPWIPENP